MCGRYTLSSPADLVADLFGLSEIPDLAPRYNIAPTQEVPVVRVLEEVGAGAEGEKKAGRRLDLLRWGLVPYWAKDPGIGNKMINARSETIAEKPAYRQSFKKRRCLVVTDGFYEWKKEGGGKQPYRIRRRDRMPFAFAGLWDRWVDRSGEQGGEKPAPLDSFTIVTTAAAPEIAEVHNRMPVIVEPGDYDLWLDPAGGDRERLAAILRPNAGALEVYAVSKMVNNPANESPKNIEPVE